MCPTVRREARGSFSCSFYCPSRCRAALLPTASADVGGAVAASFTLQGPAEDTHLPPARPVLNLTNVIIQTGCAGAAPIPRLWATSDWQRGFVSPADPTLFAVPDDADCPMVTAGEAVPSSALTLPIGLAGLAGRASLPHVHEPSRLPPVLAASRSGAFRFREGGNDSPTCHECAVEGRCTPLGPYCQGCSYDPSKQPACMGGGCCCNC